MSELWIGVIGSLVGVVLGAVLSGIISLREQQREPRLMMLEKRIDAYGKLYSSVYAILTCFHQSDRENMQFRIDEFRTTLFSHQFYLDELSYKALFEVFNYLMKALDAGGLNPDKLIALSNDALKALREGINIKYV